MPSLLVCDFVFMEQILCRIINVCKAHSDKNSLGDTDMLRTIAGAQYSRCAIKQPLLVDNAQIEFKVDDCLCNFQSFKRTVDLIIPNC